jgi:FtsP/CotA-like multicopper oxidase with cupredoxin domain
MSRGQRMGFLGVAALIAVAAVVLLGGSGGDDEQPAGAATEPAQAPTETQPREAGPVEEEEPEPTPTPRPRPPLLTAGDPQTLRVSQGERVRFRVRHDTPEHVHVHGYDIFKDLEPGETATVSFVADITGIFEIELEDSHQLLANLRVDP